MTKYVNPSECKKDTLPLAERYPVLHRRFGDEVLRDFVAACPTHLQPESLEKVARRNPDVAKEVVELILRRKVELLNSQPVDED